MVAEGSAQCHGSLDIKHTPPSCEELAESGAVPSKHDFPVGCTHAALPQHDIAPGFEDGLCLSDV